MSKRNFKERLREAGPIILDGAMGTMLFQRLPGFSGCFESLNIDDPGSILAIHGAYLDAGAEVILTNSFGGSRIKLAEYGLEGRCSEINEAAAAIARRAVCNRKAFVAGSMGPTGMLMEPMGELRADDAYASFAEQARGLARGGADLLVIETMTDLLEAMTALRAARAETGLPVVCSMSFEDNGRTVTGSDMLTALATLAENGADAVGANCSMGPEGLYRLYADNIDRLRELCTPMTVWANAGMPAMVDGRAVYSVGPERYARRTAMFAELGLKIIGGCCGTTPEHIAALTRHLEPFREEKVPCERRYRWITSRFRAIDSSSGEFLRIGERLNPTARKKFAEELKAGQWNFLRDESRKQEAEGAHILDVNVGVPGIDEEGTMAKCISILSGAVKTPLMIDSDNHRVLEGALKLYPGVPVINSVSGKIKSIETLLPLLERYGTFVVGLCLDETGIHREAEKRIAVGERLLDMLAEHGIGRERVYIDPLMLAESAEPGSAVETLKVIAHFAGKGVKTSVGLSNISFGLPRRKHINNAFLAMALERGLSAAIINTASVHAGGEAGEEEKAARDFLEGRDPRAALYIARFAGDGAEKTAAAVKGDSCDVLGTIYGMVVEGDADAMAPKVEEALASHGPEEIMNNALIRGLEKVGDLYSAGEFFLPQMIASAQAMKTGFERLKPLLKKEGIEKKGRVVICTVRGDVHDIGKNIVAMMLENHGFEVIDLGKDVETERVIEAVKESGAKLLCLSSLLTTTMGEMEAVSNIIKKEGLPARLIVGGAVVTRDYAEKIGALYGEDAVEAVKAAQRAVNEG